MAEKLAEVGSFCPNEFCEQYGQTEKSRVIRYGQTQNGTQRYRCKVCGKTFTETKGTIFYRLQKPPHDVLEVLALLADGTRISSLSRAKGFKEDTILDWLRKAATHAEQMERYLLNEYHVDKAQIDALWTFVKNKGKKKSTKRASKQESSGERQ